MKNLNIKMKVKNKIEAWKIVTHLGFEFEITEAEFDGKIHIFNEDNKTKDFLATPSMLVDGDDAEYPEK